MFALTIVTLQLQGLTYVLAMRDIIDLKAKLLIHLAEVRNKAIIIIYMYAFMLRSLEFEQFHTMVIH